MKLTKEKFIILGIFAALILGSLTGYYFPKAAVKFEFLGSLFFNALYMIIVPLIVSSMIVGITALGDIRKLGKTARNAIVYFMATSAIAVILGMILAVAFNPGGAGRDDTGAELAPVNDVTIGSIASRRGVVDSLITLTLRAPDQSSALSISGQNIPAGASLIDNGDGSASFTWRPDAAQTGRQKIIFFVNDSFKGQITEEVTFDISDGASLGFTGMLKRIGQAMIQTLDSMIPRNIVKAAAETQVLALIVFSLLFGGVLSSMGATAKPVVSFFEVLNKAIMKLVHLVMFLAPLGVFGIVASKVGDEAGGFEQAAVGIGVFSVVVLLGILIHTGLLLAALRYLGDRRPLAYLSNMSEALGTALGVSSSSATLPVTMECVVEKNRVDQRAASFVLPLGTTINMDGTAMYQAISAIFVCQMFNIPLGIEHYFIMLITAVLASVGTPGLPQAGIVMMSIVMGSVGVPAEIIAKGIGIILVVDWALDRARTALNVFGDSVGAAIIANTFEFKTAVTRRQINDGRGGERRERAELTVHSGRSRSESGGSYRQGRGRDDNRGRRAPSGGRSAHVSSRPRRTVTDFAQQKRELDSMVSVASIDMESLTPIEPQPETPEQETFSAAASTPAPDTFADTPMSDNVEDSYSAETPEMSEDSNAEPETKSFTPGEPSLFTEKILPEEILPEESFETQTDDDDETSDTNDAGPDDSNDEPAKPADDTHDEEDQPASFGRGRRRG